MQLLDVQLSTSASASHASFNFNHIVPTIPPERRFKLCYSCVPPEDTVGVIALNCSV